MKKYILMIIAFGFLAASCSISSHYIQTGSQSYPETNFENIKIYVGEPQDAFTVIGSVTADAPGDQNAAVKKLKKEASEIGADAIIHIKLDKLNSFAARTGISGVAVKMK